MDERSLSEILGDAVDEVIAGGDPVPARGDPGLAALIAVAARLRDLPREEFRSRLGAELERRAKMIDKSNAAPEGYHTATPYLILKGADAALEFYKKVFSATELLRVSTPDGRIGHAAIKIGDSPVMLADEFPEMGIVGPHSLGGSAVSIHLYVDDADALAERMISAGAEMVNPVKEHFPGYRAGKLTDPFGHAWIVASVKKRAPA